MTILFAQTARACGASSITIRNASTTARTVAHEWTVELMDKLQFVYVSDRVEVVRKPVAGYEGQYEVDNLGRVFSIDRVKRVDDNGRIYDKPITGRQMQQGLKSNGYKVVSLTKDGITKSCYVHRLVAKAFIPNPDNLPLVNHKDEDKTNNFVDNLEWCTVLYNNTYNDAHLRAAEKKRGVLHTEEHKQRISESLKAYYKTHESKQKGRESEKRKPVIVWNPTTGDRRVFESATAASEYVGDQGGRNLRRAIHTGMKVKGYCADWFCANGERRENNA